MRILTSIGPDHAPLGTKDRVRRLPILRGFCRAVRDLDLAARTRDPARTPSHRISFPQIVLTNLGFPLAIQGQIAGTDGRGV